MKASITALCQNNDKGVIGEIALHHYLVDLVGTTSVDVRRTG